MENNILLSHTGEYEKDILQNNSNNINLYDESYYSINFDKPIYLKDMEAVNPLMENLSLEETKYHNGNTDDASPNVITNLKDYSSHNNFEYKPIPNNFISNNDNNINDDYETDSFFGRYKAQKYGPDDTKLKELINRTGYSHTITAGQRKYGGPPPDYEGSPPFGCEVYCGKIPKDIYEDELIPLFEGIGKIWDFRLMIDSLNGGISRGFAFVQYVDKEFAEKAVKTLNNYEIRPGKYLKLNISIPNLRLFVGNIPKSKSKEEIMDEFTKITDGLVDVIVYSTPGEKRKNRGFCFLQYESHLAASIAKKRLTNPNFLGNNYYHPLANNNSYGQTLNGDARTSLDSVSLSPTSPPPPSLLNGVTVAANSVTNGGGSINNYWPFKRIWNCDIIVEWAQVQEEPPQETMAKVKVLYVSNLTNNVEETDLKELFEKYGTIQHVKKVKDYAFVHFSTREEALEAMKELQEYNDLKGQDGIPVKIALAKPPLDKKNGGGGGVGLNPRHIHGNTNNNNGYHHHQQQNQSCCYTPNGGMMTPHHLKGGSNSIYPPNYAPALASISPYQITGKKSRHYSSQLLASANPQYLYYLLNYGQPLATAAINSLEKYGAASNNGSPLSPVGNTPYQATTPFFTTGSLGSGLEPASAYYYLNTGYNNDINYNNATTLTPYAPAPPSYYTGSQGKKFTGLPLSPHFLIGGGGNGGLFQPPPPFTATAASVKNIEDEVGYYNKNNNYKNQQSNELNCSSSTNTHPIVPADYISDNGFGSSTESDSSNIGPNNNNLLQHSMGPRVDGSQQLICNGCPPGPAAFYYSTGLAGSSLASTGPAFYCNYLLPAGSTGSPLQNGFSSNNNGGGPVGPTSLPFYGQYSPGTALLPNPQAQQPDCCSLPFPSSPSFLADSFHPFPYNNNHHPPVSSCATVNGLPTYNSNNNEQLNVLSNNYNAKILQHGRKKNSSAYNHQHHLQNISSSTAISESGHVNKNNYNQQQGNIFTGYVGTSEYVMGTLPNAGLTPSSPLSTNNFYYQQPQAGTGSLMPLPGNGTGNALLCNAVENNGNYYAILPFNAATNGGTVGGGGSSSPYGYITLPPPLAGGGLPTPPTYSATESELLMSNGTAGNLIKYVAPSYLKPYDGESIVKNGNGSSNTPSTTVDSFPLLHEVYQHQNHNVKQTDADSTTTGITADEKECILFPSGPNLNTDDSGLGMSSSSNESSSIN